MKPAASLDDLYYFAKVVDHGGFAAAGRALDIPKSRLSRHVDALEQRLGLRLLQRSTRRFQVTDVGREVHRHALAMLDQAEAAFKAAASASAEPRGTLRIACPVAVATGMLASGAPTKEAWKYFPTTDSWEQINPVPGPSRHRATALQGEGGVLIIGGADSTGTVLDDAWSYPVWFETGTYYPEASLPAPRYGMKGGSNHVAVLVGGADSDSTFHADAWKGPADNWAALPSFPGGSRRGGIGAGIEASNNWNNTFFFGLGLDQGMMRHKDWWRLDFATGIHQEDLQRIGLFPNPAHDAMIVTWPSTWPEAHVRIVDALGRTVLDRQVNSGSPVDVRPLSAGRYVVIAHHGPVQLQGILTKLP